MIKKALFFTILLNIFFLFTTNLKAGIVSIDSTSDSGIGLRCNYARTIMYEVFGSYNGYNIGDTIIFKIYFGDGTTEIQKEATIDSSGHVYTWFSHNYTSLGLYSVKYKLIGPDMAADSVIITNALVFSDFCGNVSGLVYDDANNNCVYDNNEVRLKGVKVSIYQRNQYKYSEWTDNYGFFYFDVPVQSNTFISTSNNGYYVPCYSSGNYNIPSIPSNRNKFAMSCGSGFDLYPYVTGWSSPGQNLNLYLNVYNTFCHSQSGTVKLIFNDSLYSYGNVASTPPSSINGDTLEWNFTSVSNDWQNTFNVNVSTYTDTSAQIDDTVCVTVIIDPIAGDSNASNNIKTFCIPVKTTYNPNSKTVSPIGVGDSGRISPNKELTYTINFQNKGNHTTRNLVILDTLDDNTLNLSSIEILGSSHNMIANIISPVNNVLSFNILKFRFDNILLPDSGTNEPESHGWVTYKIQQQPNLQNGTTIQNAAYIYFDYNPAVVTNYTLNTIDDQIVGIKSIKKNQSKSFVSIYPNPAKATLHIDFVPNFQATELRILDINGKLIRTVNNLHPSNRLNVSDLESGIYLIEMRTLNGNREVKKVLINQ